LDALLESPGPAAAGTRSTGPTLGLEPVLRGVAVALVEFRLVREYGVMLNPPNPFPALPDPAPAVEAEACAEVEDVDVEVGMTEAEGVTKRAKVDMARKTPRADLHILKRGRSWPVPVRVSFLVLSFASIIPRRKKEMAEKRNIPS
jgi:hypothetical protein